MSKVIVKFKKGNGRYNAGELAGFEPEKAKKLEKAGIVEIKGKPKKAAADSKPKKAAADSGAGAPPVPGAK